MAKKTYIYRMLIGKNKNTDVDIFLDIYLYARNADVAKDFCKEKYKKEHYNYYKAIKVGVAHTLKDTQILQDEEAEKLMNSIASLSDKYSEREIEAPKFITKEEAGEMNL